MASWIVLDWDQDQFHIVVAQTSRRNVGVTRALTWAHPEPFTPSTAERVGKALREFLNSAKIAAAPVIVGLGRDRVFLKELRFPAIEAHEEAGLVRFQTAKELTESIESYAVDYVHLNGDKGDREIMTVAARRDMVGMIQTLCQAAGLKLHAVTPRVFGVGQALTRAVRPDPSPLAPNRLNAVLSIGQRWAELCFFKGERLLQAQALANGPLLVSEVKRNLAVFQAQHAVNVDLSGPDRLYVFGENGTVAEALRGGQALPIEVLNPLQDEPEIAADLAQPACFAGGVGLVALWSGAIQRPVNLAAPKRQAAPTSISRQRGLLWGAVATVALLLMFGLLWGVLAHKRAHLRELATEKNRFEKLLADNKQERADLEAYKDWEQTTVPWLDELYDLTQRFPHEQGFRVNNLTAVPLAQKKNVKNSPIAKISLKGILPTDKDAYIKRLSQSISADAHLKPYINNFQGKNFDMHIEIAKQPLADYTTVLDRGAIRKVAAPAAEEKKMADPEAGEDDE